MITVRGLRVRYGSRDVLRDADLDAPTGTVTGVVGPNGCGKSTLLRAIIGAVRPCSGTVEIDGTGALSRSARWMARRVAYMGQRVQSDPALTVIDEIALGSLAATGLFGASSAALQQRVADAVAAVGLTDRAGAGLATLSGGELQRVAIARTLTHAAPHVLLDEPTNHLDVRHQLEIIGMLRQLAPTVVVVLHDLHLAARVCDQVVLMADGEIVAAGTAEQVLVPHLVDRVYQVRTRVLTDHTGIRHFAHELPDPN